MHIYIYIYKEKTKKIVSNSHPRFSFLDLYDLYEHKIKKKVVLKKKEAHCRNMHNFYYKKFKNYK